MLQKLRSIASSMIRSRYATSIPSSVAEADAYLIFLDIVKLDTTKLIGILHIDFPEWSLSCLWSYIRLTRQKQSYRIALRQSQGAEKLVASNVFAHWIDAGRSQQLVSAFSRHSCVSSSDWCLAGHRAVRSMAPTSRWSRANHNSRAKWCADFCPKRSRRYRWKASYKSYWCSTFLPSQSFHSISYFNHS